MSLQEMGTGELWLLVQRDLIASAQVPRLGAADTEASVWDMVNTAMSAAVAALEAVEDGVSNPYQTLTQAHALLIEAWRRSFTAGLTTAADGIAILADRVASAIDSVGSSGAKAFHNFIGASPAQIGGGVLLMTALGFGAAALVLSGPGGQAALVKLASRQFVL